MSQSFNCPWCGSSVQKARYPLVQSFLLSFEVGTTSDLFGPSLEGYEIEDLCAPCAWKLKEELIRLGIEIQEINT